MGIDRGSTVFIIEDDPICAEPLQILLKWRLGVGAAVYDQADLFAAAFDPSRAGCLLLDLATQGSRGLEALGDLARRGMLPPTVILTNDGPSSTLSHALQPTPIDLLVKPVDPERLVRSVREALEIDRRRRGPYRSVAACK